MMALMASILFSDHISDNFWPVAALSGRRGALYVTVLLHAESDSAYASQSRDGKRGGT